MNWPGQPTDGQPISVGVPVTINSIQYHELAVQKRPSHGGKADSLLVRFIVRNFESTFVPVPVGPDFVRELVAWDNVIAVEVHQASASSSDLVLDLELVARFYPPLDSQ